MHPYLRDITAGSDGIDHAHALVIRVVTPPQEILVSHEVRPLIHHEAAALHPAGVAAAQVGSQLRAVAAGLIGATLEVSVLVEDDLIIHKQDALHLL